MLSVLDCKVASVNAPEPIFVATTVGVAPLKVYVTVTDLPSPLMPTKRYWNSPRTP